MQSIRENDFECLASTGVKSPAKAKIRRAGAEKRHGVDAPLAVGGDRGIRQKPGI
jgi:hypothetical protein